MCRPGGTLRQQRRLRRSHWRRRTAGAAAGTASTAGAAAALSRTETARAGAHLHTDATLLLRGWRQYQGSPGWQEGCSWACDCGVWGQTRQVKILRRGRADDVADCRRSPRRRSPSPAPLKRRSYHGRSRYAPHAEGHSASLFAPLQPAYDCLATASWQRDAVQGCLAACF